eukprot:m.1998 g.1998  ORF g.1998 m.1998 type:complete len:60 (-) comp2434_c0_seq1:112-291(-)
MMMMIFCPAFELLDAMKILAQSTNQARSAGSVSLASRKHLPLASWKKQFKKKKPSSAAS